MKDDLRVAAACLDAGEEIGANLDRAERLVRAAARRGARLVALPENFAWRGPRAGARAVAEPVPGPITRRFAALARALDVWILLGSLAERSGRGRPYNTSVLLSPAGRIAARYRKVHLFDVDLPGGARLRESATVQPGDRLAVADVDGWRVGLQVCYDLRFAEAAIALRAAGAEVLLYPSNFTRETGRAHWRALLAARATETGCYVVAPAQAGRHPGLGIETNGDAVVLDPWGVVVARRAGAGGLAVATLRRARLEEVRARLPVFRHRRPETYRVR